MSQLWEPTGYTEGARARLSVWGSPDGIRSRLDIYDDTISVETVRAMLADALDRLLHQRSDDWMQGTASVMNVVAMQEGEPVDGLEYSSPDHYPDMECDDSWNTPGRSFCCKRRPVSRPVADDGERRRTAARSIGDRNTSSDSGGFREPTEVTDGLQPDRRRGP